MSGYIYFKIQLAKKKWVYFIKYECDTKKKTSEKRLQGHSLVSAAVEAHRR